MKIPADVQGAPGSTVTVIGGGAVGLSSVLAAKRRGAERISLMGRHTSRTDLGRQWGATDIVAERGEEGIAKALDLTGGEGSHVVLEAVGLMPAHEQAYGVVRPGVIISRVGVPQYEEAPIGFGSLSGKSARLAGGQGVRRRSRPRRGRRRHKAMDDRSRLKVLV